MLSKFVRRGYDSSIDSIGKEGFSREEASSEKGRRVCDSAVKNLLMRGLTQKKRHRKN